jgi:hypothetical protein
MDIVLIRTASVLAVAFIYMLFDVFNKRNVPSIFAYATLAYGVLLTVLYFNLSTIAESLGISLVIIGVGYVVYRIGQIGAADFIEFAALSLMIPIQPTPYLLNAPMQLGIPFIGSLIINTGIIAIILVPIYYIYKSFRVPHRGGFGTIRRVDVLKAVTMVLAYAAFIIVLFYFHARPIGLAIVALAGLGSVAITLGENRITKAMVSYWEPAKMKPEDMLAFNLMEPSEIKRIKTEIKSFDRLVTEKMLKEFKEKKFEEQLPVYTHAVPLALPLLIGVIFALLFGNLILFVLPAI